MSGRLPALVMLMLLSLVGGCSLDGYERVDDRWRERLDELVRRQAEAQEADAPEPTAIRTASASQRSDAVADPWAELSDPDADAGTALDLSLERAVLLALRFNRELRVERYEPVAAGAFELIERGVFDPELYAELNYREEESSETARSTGQQFSVQAEDVDGGVGVRQELPTGTSVDASVTQSRSVSNRAPEQQEARMGLTVTQSLLRGLGPSVNLASVRQAELETLATRYQLRAFAEALLAQVERAYWDFVLADREIAIFERSLELARQQRDDLDERIAIGTLAETDGAVARAEVARREQALIDARSELEARRYRLMRLISPDSAAVMDRPLRARTTLEVGTEPVRDLPERLSLAMRSRPEINEALLRLDQRRLETVVTRNGLLPRLDVFVTLGTTGFDDTFSGSFNELGGETYDFAAGVSYSQFLGDRVARGRDLEARALRSQAAEAVENLRQMVRMEVQLAANEVNRAREQVTATATTRELQERVVFAERQRFELGTSTALLVAQAQRDLLAAEIAEVEAMVSYRLALVELYRAEGSLLERRGVSLAETDTGR